MQQVEFHNKNYYGYFDGELPNNTFFLSFKRYRAQQNQFEEQFIQEYHGDFHAYLSWLKKEYPSLF